MCSRIDVCENGNAFPPAATMSHRHFTLSDSDTLITEDEYWFAVDASNDDIRYNAEELAIVYANFYHTAKV